MMTNKPDKVITRLNRRRSETNRQVILFLESKVAEGNYDYIALKDIVYHIGYVADGKKSFSTHGLSAIMRDLIRNGSVEKDSVMIGKGRYSAYRIVCPPVDKE
jgi:enterochelin esterase-like enzyme